MLKEMGAYMAVSENHQIIVCVITVVYFTFLSVFERAAFLKSYNLIGYAGTGRSFLSLDHGHGNQEINLLQNNLL